jgi:hypothetical protein
MLDGPGKQCLGFLKLLTMHTEVISETYSVKDKYWGE